MAIKPKLKIYTCKVCKAKYEKWSNDGFRQWCSFDCKVVWAAKKGREKVRRDKAKERKRIKAEKEKEKTVTQLASDLKRHLQWIARQIDKDKPCICTGEWYNEWDGGHYWPAGTPKFRCVAFHMDNIHKQNKQSNQHLHGDIASYTKGLKERYGDDYLQMVLDLPTKYRDIKWGKLELREWIEKAQEIRNQIKKGTPYTRTAVNKALGIYK